MIDTWLQPLPHGITLSCRGAGPRGRPVLMFLHGFPEAAFVWDELLLHFARPEHGGYRCVAPNLRGYAQSSAPTDVAAYRPKHLVQDVLALIDAECGPQGALAALVAHDWGGAVAWNLANQQAHRLHKLAILNSPHPGAFVRELQRNPAQQAASAYMNFLVRPDAAHKLSANGFAKLLGFLRGTEVPGDPVVPATWLTPALEARYREVWAQGLEGPLNYYRASPLRPARGEDPGANAIDLPDSACRIEVPTLVIWGQQDAALLPALTDGLADWIAQLRLVPLPHASHWLVHEQPARVAQELADFLSASA